MTHSNVPSLSHSLGSIYEALLDRRRRLVLHHLRETPDGVSQFDAVTSRVHKWEANVARESDSSHDEETIAVTLHHVHLPMLARYGLVDYDWRTKTIRYQSDDLLEKHLDLARPHDLHASRTERT